MMKRDGFAVSWPFGMASLGVAVAAGVSLVQLARFRNAGLELTDEALYILMLRENSVWGLPWAWNARWIWEFASGDLGVIRSVAIGLTVLSGGFLGYFVSRWLERHWTGRKSIPGQTSLLTMLGGTSSLVFYGGALRTPSYNWLNFVTIQLFLSLVFAYSARPRKKYKWELLSTNLFGSAIGILAFLASTAKPTTSVWMISSAGLVIAFTRSRFFGILIATAAGTTAIAAVAAATWSGMWPPGWRPTIHHSVTAPAPSALQTPLGGSREVVYGLFTLPSEAVAAALSLFSYSWASATLTIFMIVVTAFRVRHGPERTGQILLFLTTTTACAAALGVDVFGGLWSWIAASSGAEWWEVRYRFTSRDPTHIVLLTIMIMTSVSVLARKPTSRFAGGASMESRSRERSAALFLLSSAPIVFAFGSSHGLIRQAGMAVVFPVLAFAVLASTSSRRTFGRLALIVIAASTSTLAIVTTADSAARPYRLQPLALQTHELPHEFELGALKVTPSQAEWMMRSRDIAHSYGLSRDTLLIPLDTGWSAISPLVLGARPPSTGMLTLDADPRIFEHNLAEVNGESEISAAWITTTPPRNINPFQVGSERDLIKIFNTETGLTFPSDYRCVGDFVLFELWQPALGLKSARNSCNSASFVPYNDVPPDYPMSLGPR